MSLDQAAFDRAIAKARRRVARMDRVDGFADRFLSTILVALKSGLMEPETGSQFDAYVMLEDVVRAGAATVRPDR